MIVLDRSKNKGLGGFKIRHNTLEQQNLIDNTRNEITNRINKRVNKELMQDWVEGKISLEDCLAMTQEE